MSLENEQDLEKKAAAMAWRAVQEFGRLTWADDSRLIMVLMRTALAYGFDFEQLERFAATRRMKCFGFFRNTTHYAGVSEVETRLSWRNSIVAQTTGDFAGLWIFMLDRDSSVLASHNGGGVEVFRDLEGSDLIEAVLTSALMEALEPVETQAAPTARKRWFGLF